MTKPAPASGAVALDILADIRTFQRGRGGACTVAPFVDGLTSEQRAAMSAARSEGIPNSAIGLWMKSLGYQGTAETVSRHLHGRCKCQTR